MTRRSTNPEPTYHWYLVGTEQAALADQCRLALGLGLASVWVDETNGADPLLLAEWLALDHGGLRLTVVVRPGSLSPVSLVQQVNTAATILAGRIDVAFDTRQAGADDAHHEHCKEFMEICHRLWRATSPQSFRGAHYRVDCAELGTSFPGDTPPRLHHRGRPNEVPIDCIWSDEPDQVTAPATASRGLFVPVTDTASVPEGVDELCLIGSATDDLARLSTELQTPGGMW